MKSPDEFRYFATQEAYQFLVNSSRNSEDQRVSLQKLMDFWKEVKSRGSLEPDSIVQYTRSFGELSAYFRVVNEGEIDVIFFLSTATGRLRDVNFSFEPLEEVDLGMLS